MASDNPYQAPQTDLSTDFEPRDFSEPIEYGGIGRGAFFGGYLLAMLCVLGVVIAIGPERVVADPNAKALIRWVLTAALVILASQRARNLGASPWWSLTLLIPLYNIVVFLRCLAFPEGWNDHKTLDSTAWVVSVLYGLLMLLFVVAVFGAAFLT